MHDSARAGAGSSTAGAWRFDKQAFMGWVKAAIEKVDSAEHLELYNFLTECFFDADADRDGFVNGSEFDFLIEKAAALPRRFGLAPGWNEQYGDVAARAKARGEMFAKMDEDKSNTIGLEEWIKYAMDHITEKVRTMPTDSIDWARLDLMGRDRFIDFCGKATSDKKSTEYKELYTFLFNSFVKADEQKKGVITLKQFDDLVEITAAVPRSLGLAPKTADMFENREERIAARRKLFDGMDADGGGTISFDEFLQYTITHIAGKVASVDKTKLQSESKCPFGLDK